MKKLLYFLLLFISVSAAAQTPSTLNYQAVLRDTDGNAQAGGTVDLTFKIYAGSASVAAWSKTYSGVDAPSVSAFGVVNTEFGGSGSGPNGTVELSDLDWAGTAYQLEVLAGTTSLGRKAFGVVPYALSAANAPQTTYTAGTGISINGTTISSTVVDTDTDTDTDEQNLTVSGNTLSLTNSTPASVTLTFTVTGNQVALNGTNVFTIPDLTPPGTIVAYGGYTAPAGWLLCDGQAYSRTDPEYSTLFSVINTNFGFPNASEFNVPDLRGMFLRGHSGTRADQWQDPDRNTREASGLNGAQGNEIGSAQANEVKAHAHENLIVSMGQIVTVGSTAGAGSVYSQGGTPPPGYATMSVSGGGSETRPNNVNVNYIIKK